MIYRYFISLTSQFYFCGVPFRLDSYKKCTYNCVYCYVKTRGGNFKSNKQLVADIQKLQRYLNNAFNHKTPNTAISECLRHRLPLHWGGMSDPFQPCEKKYRISLRILQILDEYGYPLIISTKSVLLISEPYLSLLKKYSNLVVQISLCTSDDSLRQKLEPNAPSVSERLKAVQILNENGIKTFCRLQPLILNINSRDEKLIKLLKRAGCKKVIIEHYKLPVDFKKHKERVVNSAIGYNIRLLYNKLGAKRVGREYILPSEVKLKNLRFIVKSIHDEGMKYCAADNDLQHLGDTECCCGIDDEGGFENWFRHNIALCIRRGYRTGNMDYSLISKEWVPKKSIRMYLNSECRSDVNRVNKLKSIKDFILYKWNQPYSTNSPTEFYNIRLGKKINNGINYHFNSDNNKNKELP